MLIFKFLLPLVKELKQHTIKKFLIFIKEGFACNASNEMLKTGMVQDSCRYLGLLVVFEKEFGDSSVGTGGRQPELPVVHYAEQFQVHFM